MQKPLLTKVKTKAKTIKNTNKFETKTNNQDSSSSDAIKDNQSKEVAFFSYENLRFLLISFAILLCVRSSIIAPFEVPTASMEPTIKVGDRIVANLLAYGLRVPFSGIEIMRWGEVKRGDIIVFKFPPQPKLDFVKRAIAVGGDSVKIVNDLVYVNSKLIYRIKAKDRSVLDDAEDNARIKSLFIETIGDQNYFVTQDNDLVRSNKHPKNWPSGSMAYKVPEGSVFVMGDNRDNSHDSRFWRSVPLENVRGKASFVLWSARPSNKTFPVLRWYRFFFSLYSQIS